MDVGDIRWPPVVVRWTSVSHGGSAVAPVAMEGGRRSSLGEGNVRERYGGLELLSPDGHLGPRPFLAPALAVSGRTATRILGAMVSAGMLMEDGTRGRGAGYCLMA